MDGKITHIWRFGNGMAVAVRLGLSTLPAGVRWAHILGVGALAGIGFTVSLFITELAYADPEVIDAAKIGVLGGSILAAALGMALLLRAGRGASPSDGLEGPDGRPVVVGDLRRVDLVREADTDLIEHVEDRVPAVGEILVARGDHLLGGGREHRDRLPDG